MVNQVPRGTFGPSNFNQEAIHEVREQENEYEDDEEDISKAIAE